VSSNVVAVEATVRPDTLEVFRSSLDRCTAHATFIQRFYARFILSSDEVAGKFDSVDLRRQATVLKSSLYMMLRAASGFDDGMAELRDIARTHSRRGYDIGAHLYEHWLRCLIAVARETDPLFDDEIEAAWKATLQPCIDAIIEAYEEGELRT